MAKKRDLLAEKRTELAEARTDLAHKRTVMADLRTLATTILFGLAFLGFSKVKGDFFYIAGIIAVAMGVFFLMGAVHSLIKHSKRIKEIKEFFDELIRYNYKKK